MDSLADRTTELEIRAAHQEKLLNDLSDVLYAQQQQLDKLETRVQLLEDTIRGGGDPDMRDPKDDVPPPHY